MGGSSSLLATRLARERGGAGGAGGAGGTGGTGGAGGSGDGGGAAAAGGAGGGGAGSEVPGGNVTGGTVLGQLLSYPWSNNTQPRTGRRRPREGADRDGGSREDGGSGRQRGPTGSRRSLPPPLTAFIHAGDLSSGGEHVVEFPVPESFSLPSSFSLPILGSREMTELFNEIFDSSRQETRRSRARRGERNAPSEPNEPNDPHDPSERNVAPAASALPPIMGNRRGPRGARARPLPEVMRPADIMRDMERDADRIEGQRYRGALRDDEERLFDSVTHSFARVPNSTGSHPSGGKMLRSPPNWFLKPGQMWNGWQHVQHWPPGTSERWSVRVVLDFVNFEKGEVFGTMTASNVPGAENNVVTYFEGEIIDNENSTFYSNPDASARTCLAELRHWSRFPSFRPLRDSVLEEDGRAPALALSGKVFMRWKEKCFLSGGADCRLTIAGLYYVTLDRVNGDIHAYYWDPNSAPEQKMNLKVGSSHQQGYSLPIHKVA